MWIKEVQSTTKMKRVATHIHIKVLGLDTHENAFPMAAGFVRQKSAWEGSGMLVDVIQQNKMARRALLVAFPPSTDKTVLALGISQEIGSKVAFCLMARLKVYSYEVKKIEVLMENF